MATSAAVTIKLRRDGPLVAAEVGPVTGGAGAPNAQLSGYWAVLEDQHESKVRAGENAGETLRHDHVVRLYKPVSAWAAAAGSRHQISVGPSVPQHPRRVVFVVNDAITQRPLQVVVMGC